MAKNEAKTGIQTEPATAAQKKGATQPSSPIASRSPRAVPGIDLVLIGAALATAFLLASTPIRNSDVLMHLATGRGIVKGSVSFGAAAFTHTAEGYWTNHSWLFDVLAYFVYSIPAIGGPALVILKGAAIAFLAFLMIRLGQAGPSRWIPLTVVMLAMVAMTPRLAFQPAVISLVFLAVTIWLLERADGSLYQENKDGKPDRDVTIKSYWPLLLLFVLWANLDEWFIFGPLTVLLYLAGALLQPLRGRLPSLNVEVLKILGALAFLAVVLAFVPIGLSIVLRVAISTGVLVLLLLVVWVTTPNPAPADPRRGKKTSILAAVLGLGIVACMINPHHVHVFEVPTILIWSGSTPIVGAYSTLTSYFQQTFTSGLGGYFYQGESSPAEIAYFVLIGAGIAGFAMNYRRGTFPRLLLWLAFFALSAYRVKLVPFFAVVGGIVTARNLHEAMEDLLARASQKKPIAWNLYGRCVTLLALVILLVLAWPGWLHRETEYRRYRIAWELELDPSLKEAAETVENLHQAGLLQGDDKNRLYNSSPIAANYFAWYCPSQKSFLDYRFKALASAQTDCTDLRTVLLAKRLQFEKLFILVEHPDGRAIREEIFARRKVQCVVLHEPTAKDLAEELYKFLLYPDQWTLLYLKGRVAVLGNVETGLGQPELAEHKVNLKARAFWPPRNSGLRPPVTGPAELAAPRPFWSNWLDRRRGYQVDSNEAELLLGLFREAYRQDELLLRRRIQEWHARLVVQTVSPSNGAAPLGMALLTPQLAWATYNNHTAEDGLTEHEQRLVNLSRSAYFQFITDRRESSLHFLYLAVHAARRAINNDPNDPRAYAVLGQIYVALQSQTDNSRVGLQLQRIRLIQAAAAFRQAVMLDDGQQEAHGALADIYASMNPRHAREPEKSYTDLQAQHLDKFVALARARGPRPGVPPEQHVKALAQLSARQRALAKRLEAQRTQLQVLAKGNHSPERLADFANTLGLPGEALKMFENLPSQQRGVPSAMTQLRLMMETGDLRGMRAGMTPEFEKSLGPEYSPAYSNLLIHRALSAGNYQLADERMAKLQDDSLYPKDQNGAVQVYYHQRASAAVARTIARRPFESANPLLNCLLQSQGADRYFVAPISNTSLDRQFILQAIQAYRNDAEQHVLRGVLAVEAAQPEKALEHFKKALSYYEPENRSSASIDFSSRNVAEAYLYHVQRAKKAQESEQAKK